MPSDTLGQTFPRNLMRCIISLQILKKAKKPRPKKERPSTRVGKAERESRGSRAARPEREEAETTSPKSQEHASEDEGEIKVRGNGFGGLAQRECVILSDVSLGE